MDVRIFGEPILFHLGPVPITETMVTSTAVTAAVLGGSFVLRSYTRWRPQSRVATVTRLIVRWLDSLVTEIVGRPEPKLTLLAGSLFIFIAVCNLAGQLPGVHPPTASLATTSALATVVFLAVPVFGIASQGMRGYVLEYFRPNPLLFPLHLVSELSRTLALSFRLSTIILHLSSGPQSFHKNSDCSF